MLKSITINGLRGFGKECTINFSLPNKEDEGSGLNIIVGPNNSGKTTITEAIKFYNSKSGEISFSEGKRNAKNSNKVDITYLDEVDEKMEIHTVKNGGSEVNTIGIKENRDIPYVLPSRRYVQYDMNSDNDFFVKRNNYSSSQIRHSRNRVDNLNQFESRIFKWNKNKDEFNKLLKKIIIEPFDWIIEQNDRGQYYLKIIFKDKSISHSREGFGDGYWSIFTIIDSLYDSKENDIIVIDEPELSLHPTFQKRVLKLIEEFSKNRQIIITTHSPYFISLNAIINGGLLIRTFKDKEGNIQTKCIDDGDRKFIESVITNLNNPHILGLEAKELFFLEDNVIITEGQEDVVIIPKICKELGVELKPSLFGWGAGGASNIKKVLKLLSNLGYEKVTAIFDGDKSNDYEECLNIYPNYDIEILPKDDIRDKKQINIKEKEGITDDHGNIKEENKIVFKELLDKINNYHNKK